MHGRGVLTVAMRGSAQLSLAGIALSLILAWPISGAGQGGGGQRVAMSLAVQVEASATFVGGATLEGTIR